MVIKVKGKTLLLAVGGIGMLATVYFTAKNTPEAQKRKEEALLEKREKTGDENAQLTFVESVKAQIGAYIPAIISGVVTVGSVVGSEVINKETLKKAEQAFDEYKDMSEKLSGKGTSKVVEKAIEQKKLDEKANKPWNREEEFRIIFQGHCIQFSLERAYVMEAIYELNRKFTVYGVVTFNEFLAFLKQDGVGEEGDERGWEAYVGETVYGYTWVDVGLKECPDEPWITEIWFPVYPHFLDEDMAESEVEEGLSKLSLKNAQELKTKRIENHEYVIKDGHPVGLKLDLPKS